MGQIVANDKIPFFQRLEKYKENLAEAFSKSPTLKRHYNTVLHIFGYFSDLLTKKEKANFIRLTNRFIERKIPLSVIIELLRGYALRFNNEYLLVQRYLNPFPEELEN